MAVNSAKDLSSLWVTLGCKFELFHTFVCISKTFLADTDLQRILAVLSKLIIFDEVLKSSLILFVKHIFLTSHKICILVVGELSHTLIYSLLTFLVLSSSLLGDTHQKEAESGLVILSHFLLKKLVWRVCSIGHLLPKVNQKWPNATDLLKLLNRLVYLALVKEAKGSEYSCLLIALQDLLLNRIQGRSHLFVVILKHLNLFLHILQL